MIYASLVRVRSLLVSQWWIMAGFIFLVVASEGVCDSGNRIVGYYASWNSANLPYDKIEYSNLTDILVAFGTPNSDGTITYDSGIPFPQMVESAHAAGVRVLISIGGAGSGPSFSAATTDSVQRAKLISNIIGFLEQNHYDGVDVDWETPTNSTETLQLTDFIREMRGQFNQTDSSWLITMAIPASDYGGKHFDIVNLISYVDWLNVMCYDFVGTWTSYSGHNSPLYMLPSDPNQAGSDSNAVVYWISRGQGTPLQNNKLVLGIPFYSVKFNAPGLYKKVSNNVTSNPYYADDMDSLSSGWTYHWDSYSSVPYLLNKDVTEFITFEDTNSVRLKVQFAVRQNLGGVMIWELSQGLYNGRQPLLETISSTMKSLTAVEATTRLASGYHLYDNYPNPFNPATTIRFVLPSRSNVSLIIYDALGREVQELIKSSLQAGSYDCVWDASRFAGGVYLCRIEAQTLGGGGRGFADVVKLLLLK